MCKDLLTHLPHCIYVSPLRIYAPSKTTSLDPHGVLLWIVGFMNINTAAGAKGIVVYWDKVHFTMKCIPLYACTCMHAHTATSKTLCINQYCYASQLVNGWVVSTRAIQHGCQVEGRGGQREIASLIVWGINLMPCLRGPACKEIALAQMLMSDCYCWNCGLFCWDRPAATVHALSLLTHP
jgi:hypothetical protein